ncbi:MAG: DUF3426 domain-containing protein [Burkholderiaceae bacterium]
MALATKCPQCGALFRVVADQLKLRGGLVRCGQCRAVFDAIGSLTYVDDSALAQTHTVTAATQPMPSASSPARSEAAREARAHKDSARKESARTEAAARKQAERGPVTRVRHGPRTRPPPATTTRALGPATTLRISPSAPATLVNAALRGSPTTPAGSAEGDAKQRARSKRERELQEQAAAMTGVPTLIAPGGREKVGADSIVDGIEVIELGPLPGNTEAEPTRVDLDIPLGEEPEFIRKGKRRIGERRGFSIVFGGGSLLLILLLITQLAVIFRTELLARVPQARDALVALCDVFGCTVGWPTQVDQLAVIGSELQAIAGTDALELTAVIRNRATFRQALPALEVTLTDSRNRPIARKVFTPADYLAAAGEPSTRIEDGLAGGSDYTIRIFFEARGVQASGFLVYPFFI